MRSKSTELMNDIADYINQYYSERHRSPSIAETAKGVGIAKTTAYRYLVEMDERGLIKYDGANKTITTDMIRKFASDFTSEFSSCPIVGSIQCGTAQTEEENIEEYISLPVSLFGKGDFYILKASGDSMVDAGIESGDRVVISKTCNAEIGDIVVALDEHRENTLKKYAGTDDETQEAILLYQNQEKL